MSTPRGVQLKISIHSVLQERHIGLQLMYFSHLSFVSFLACSPEGEIRLVGGNDIAGRVEICHNGRWLSICGDGWDTANANVTCRQLDYTSGRLPHSGYEGTTTNTWIQSFNCTGREDTLMNCSSRDNGAESGVLNRCLRQEDFANVKCFSGDLADLGPRWSVIFVLCENTRVFYRSFQGSDQLTSSKP